LSTFPEVFPCYIDVWFLTDDDPRTIKEVVDLEDGNLWKKTMDEEMEA
jgi:hypothetical protein